MTPFALAKANRRWAMVGAIATLGIIALEAYAITQGIAGESLFAAIVALAAIGGAGVSRWAR